MINLSLSGEGSAAYFRQADLSGPIPNLVVRWSIEAYSFLVRRGDEFCRNGTANGL